MKSRLKKGLICLAFTTVISVGGFASNKSKPDKKAFAENSSYCLTFDSSDRNNFSYHYLTKQFTKKNYIDEDIVFKYKRCRSQSSYFTVMSPGGCLYNPYLTESENLNSLCGMYSITAVFASVTGHLYVSYGIDNNYTDTNIELTSGVPLEFNSFKPSHFMISTVDNVNPNNDVYITSLTIQYHSNNYYDAQQHIFTNIISNRTTIDTFELGSSNTYSLENTNIGNNNYINIRYKSTQPLKGTLNYYDLTKSKNVSETIFLERKNTFEDFNTFLDSFRKGSSGETNKRLTSLVLTNVGSNSANVVINQVGYTDRAYSRNDIFYISDSTIEVGISLQFAGSISSIKNLDQNIQEYVDTNYEIKIRGSDKHSGDINNIIRNNPNLINVYDVGREIQQSYYMNVDSAQGYTRGKFNGNYVSYNPVQAGDMNNNESQIIDYRVTYDPNNAAKATSIWIKTKALDWAKSNSLSQSYMENSYSIENGLLKVSNRFIDFSGWTNYENNAGFPQNNYNTNGNTFLSTSEAPLFAIQELPAVYVAHPLNYFSSFFSTSQNSSSGKLIFDNSLGWNTGTTAIESDNNLISNGSYLGETTYQNANSGCHYEFRRHYENWLGFFNEDKFGVAVYVPANNYNHESSNDRHVFISGMYSNNHGASNTLNRSYLDTDYNSQTASFNTGYTVFGHTYGKTDLTKDSCYMNNTGYLTTSLGFYVPNYSALEYSYLIGADYLNTLRSKFNNAAQTNALYNDFTAWKGACI